MGKQLRCHLKEKNLQDMGNGTKYSDNSLAPWSHLLPSRGNIHVHYHSIQTSSSLKFLGQSKTTFKESIYKKGETNVYIKTLSHMTKTPTTVQCAS